MIVKFHQVEFPKSWIIWSVNRVRQRREHICFLEAHSHSLSLWKQIRKTEHSYAESLVVWLQVIFAVTYSCLWTASGAWTLTCLLSAAASVKPVALCSGQPWGREARGWQRGLSVRDEGGLWPSPNCPGTCILALESWKQKKSTFTVWCFGRSFWRGQ